MTAAVPPPGRPPVPWEPVPGAPVATWQASAMLIRIELTPTELRLRGPRVRTTVARSAVAYAILGLHHAGPGGADQRVLFLFDDQRRLICRLFGSVWGDAAIFDLVRNLAPPVIDVIEAPSTTASVAARHPGLLPGRVQHPGRFPLVALAVLVGTLVVVALVFAIATS